MILHEIGLIPPLIDTYCDEIRNEIMAKKMSREQITLLKFWLVGSLSLPIFFIGMLLFPEWTTEGTGIVQQRIYRARGASNNPGYFIQVEHGKEIRIDRRLWHIIKEGDHLSKEPFSLVYTINHTAHDTFLEDMWGLLFIWGLLFTIIATSGFIAIHAQFQSKQEH